MGISRPNDLSSGRLVLATLAVGFLLGATPETVEQPSEPLPYPPGLSMPWRLLNIDSEEAARTRPALTASAKSLASSWLTAPEPVTKLLTRIKPTRNNQRITDQILAGQPKSSIGTPSITVEPSWCSIMNRHLFFVTVTDSKLNTVLGSAHTAINRRDWAKLKTKQQMTDFLTGKLQDLTTGAISKATAKPKLSTDALHVGLSLGKEVTRVDEGSSWCLNQLVEEKLAPDFTVARSLGHDHLGLLRDLLGQPAALRRPTRILVGNWTHEDTEEFKPAVPVKFTFKAALLDSVYGKHIHDDYMGEWLGRDGPESTIDLTGPGFDSLTVLLRDEAKTLQLSDLPQVVKRDRAWVYLDRGRAWGLKMNDRLVAEVDGEIVKGHVVHFYGPEAKLKSPRGFPVEEGAVLFIRLNQKLPRTGTTFKFDPRTFPTKYPP